MNIVMMSNTFTPHVGGWHVRSKRSWANTAGVVTAFW